MLNLMEQLHHLTMDVQPLEFSTYSVSCLPAKRIAYCVQTSSVDRCIKSQSAYLNLVFTTPEDYEQSWIHCILSQKLMLAYRGAHPNYHFKPAHRLASSQHFLEFVERVF